MTSQFGENSTVTGEIPFKGQDSPTARGFPRGHHGNTDKSRLNEFTTVDYTIEERPFFIPIGKDGVIGALEKLDRQLREVG